MTPFPLVHMIIVVYHCVVRFISSEHSGVRTRESMLPSKRKSKTINMTSTILKLEFSFDQRCRKKGISTVFFSIILKTHTYIIETGRNSVVLYMCQK